MSSEKKINDECKATKHSPALSENLAVTQSEGVDNGDEITGSGLVLLRDEGPKLVNVDGGAPRRVVGLVEVPHSD